jgi:hypothetical protein
MANLKTLQATGLLTTRAVADYTKQAEQQKLSASRQATDGMVAGLGTYADAATNAGAAARHAVQHGLQGMEDALVQFVTTGQISFASLTNSILSDLARIAVRQVTGSVAQGLSGALGGGGGGGGGIGNIFSSLVSSLIGSIGGGGGDGGTGPGTGYTYHSGGIVGTDGTPRSNVPLSLFANAQRYHTGGLIGADEVPIIAQRGERVLTAAQQAAMGGAPPPVSVTVVNNGEPMNARTGGMTSNGQGGFNIDVILSRIDDHQAKGLANGSSKTSKALEGRYGVRPVPRR